MMMTLIADIALAVTVVLALGALAALVLRSGSPALRHAAWRATLAGVWLAPLAVLVAGMLPVQRPEIAVPMPRYAPTPRAIEAEVAPVEEPVAEVTADTGRALAEPAAPKPLPVAAILLRLWGAGALVALVVFTRDATALRTLLSEVEAAADDRPATAEAIADRLGLTRLPRIVRSSEVTVPAVAGWLQPTLVLPADGRADEAALIHELAHVQRGDVPTLAAARLTAAVWWWHPLAWLMLRGLAATAEEACDDVVLALTGARGEYAQMLTHWAERTTVAGSINCSSRGRALIARVRRVLDERARPVVALPRKARMAVALAAATAVLAAGALRVRAADGSTEGRPSTVETQQVTIAGTVIGPDRTGLGGATVMTEHRRPNGGGEWVWSQTMTRADGTFQLAFECERARTRYDVLAMRSGYALAWQRVESGQEARIALGASPATCAGVVVDPQGNPLGGIDVRVRWLQLGEGDDARFLSLHGSLKDFTSPLATETSEDGRFEFGGLPADAKVTVTARGEGWAYFMHMGPDVPRTGERVTITLYPEATISGHVTRQGQGVAGTPIAAIGRYHGWGEAITGEDGSYTIRSLPAATYKVVLRDTSDWTAAAVEGIHVTAGQHVEGADLELVEGAIVEGTVTLAHTGEPAVGAYVRAEGPAGATWRGAGDAARTDEKGRYEIRLAPGKNKVEPYLDFEGYREAQPSEVWVNVANEERKTGVDFVLGSLSPVTGMALSPDGTPAAGVKVWLGQPGFPGQKPEPQVTDDEGRFEFEARSQPGEPGWLLFARDSERGLAGVSQVRRLQERAIVSLAPGAYLTSEVVTDAEPVPDFAVTVLVENSEGTRRGSLPLQSSTDEQGALDIGPLPTRVRLRLLPTDETARYAVNAGDWTATQLYLKPRETRTLPALRLDLAGRSVRGRVIDSHQQPVAGAQVISLRRMLQPTMQGIDGSGFEWGSRTETNQEGRFELTGVSPAGMVRLLAITADRRRACVVGCNPDLDPEPTLTVRRPGTLMGVVYGPDGEPRAGLTVSLHAVVRCQWEDGTITGGLGGLPLRTRTDERGRWRFEGLIPGASCRVQAADPTGGLSGTTGAEYLEIDGGDLPAVADIYMQ
ncbi:MAG: M56 family metallopeptidase [Armatimonadota bacterium]|nr:M56 family metallopeptidase [Armatimonadota bacterium]